MPSWLGRSDGLDADEIRQARRKRKEKAECESVVRSPKECHGDRPEADSSQQPPPGPNHGERHEAARNHLKLEAPNTGQPDTERSTWSIEEQETQLPEPACGDEQEPRSDHELREQAIVPVHAPNVPSTNSRTGEWCLPQNAGDESCVRTWSGRGDRGLDGPKRPAARARRWMASKRPDRRAKVRQSHRFA